MFDIIFLIQNAHVPFLYSFFISACTLLRLLSALWPHRHGRWGLKLLRLPPLLLSLHWGQQRCVLSSFVFRTPSTFTILGARMDRVDDYWHWPSRKTEALLVLARSCDCCQRIGRIDMGVGAHASPPPSPPPSSNWGQYRCAQFSSVFWTPSVSAILGARSD